MRATADELSQLLLHLGRPSRVNAAAQGLVNGVQHHPLQVAVEAGGELAKEVDVPTTVEEPQEEPSPPSKARGNV